jgi:hypothetical protein
MDQARWVGVFSVIICMLVTLTVLYRSSRNTAKIVETAQNSTVESSDSRSAMVAVSSSDTVSGFRERRKYGRISFPRPAAHTVAVDSDNDFSRNSELLLTEGKIAE